MGLGSFGMAGLLPGWNKWARFARLRNRNAARRRKRTQETPNEPNLALNIQISKNIWFPKRTRFQAKEVANGGPRRRDFGWRRGICKDNAVTGARVRQPGFIVTDDHQISGARDFGMHAKPDERKGIQILGRSVMGAAGLVGSRGGASALPIRSFEPGLKRGDWVPVLACTLSGESSGQLL